MFDEIGRAEMLMAVHGMGSEQCGSMVWQEECRPIPSGKAQYSSVYRCRLHRRRVCNDYIFAAIQYLQVQPDAFVCEIMCDIDNTRGD